MVLEFASSHTQQITSELVAALQTPESEFTVGLLVSQLIDPDLQVESFKASFADFINPFREQLAGQPALSADLLLWFQDAGFTAPQTAVDARHSDLSFVLRERQGIPIAQALLLLEAARRCQVPAFGINFPGHFLLALDNHITDPVSYSLLDTQSLAEKGVRREHMQPATPAMIALRMLNNLKALKLQLREINEALAIVDIQLAISGDQAELAASLHFERGEFWQQLGAVSAAREAFELCAELCPFPQLAEKAKARAEKLAGNSETWH